MKFAILFFLSTGFLAADQIRDFWFSGAEISSFTLQQSRYGKTHPGHAELIFVTERFLPEKQVKDEKGRENSVEILKLNALTTFNTGIYSYRTMTSTFKPIDLHQFPNALKSTTSIQDWCGQAFQQFNYRNKQWNIELRSYFENFGDAKKTIPSALLEDEVWLTLRLDPKRLPQGKIQMIPGAIFTRFHHQKIQAMTAHAALKQQGSLSIYQVTYPDLKRTLSIHFDQKFPHIIRKWTDATAFGTTTAKLKKRLMNLNYWDLNRPQDSKQRGKLGLKPIAD